MAKDILESTLPGEVNRRLMENHSIGWNDSLTVETLSDFLQAAIKFLSFKKSKDKPVVLELNDLNGGFHFAAYVSFLNQAEETSDDGSWSIGFTFDQNEIEPDWIKYDFNQDKEATMTFYDVTYNNSGIKWKFEPDADNPSVNEGTIANILPLILDTLADYMRMNVHANPELDVSGLVVFKAEEATNGVYITSKASPTLKQMIKNDNEIDDNA